jgi:hypothetical protein
MSLDFNQPQYSSSSDDYDEGDYELENQLGSGEGPPREFDAEKYFGQLDDTSMDVQDNSASTENQIVSRPLRILSNPL